MNESSAILFSVVCIDMWGKWFVAKRPHWSVCFSLAKPYYPKMEKKNIAIYCKCLFLAFFSVIYSEKRTFHLAAYFPYSEFLTTFLLIKFPEARRQQLALLSIWNEFHLRSADMMHCTFLLSLLSSSSRHTEWEKYALQDAIRMGKMPLESFCVSFSPCA